VFRINVDLFDNEPGATVKDCLTRFNVPCLVFDNFHSARYSPALLATPRRRTKINLGTDNPLNGTYLDIPRHSVDTSTASWIRGQEKTLWTTGNEPQ
jgi:hypothetical protein